MAAESIRLCLFPKAANELILEITMAITASFKMRWVGSRKFSSAMGLRKHWNTTAQTGNTICNMQEIPVIDLNKQYQSIRPELDDALSRIFAKGTFILGVEVAAFEREFAEYCGVSHAVGVASGTEALQLALLACGIGENDEVIAPAHTAVATVSAVEATGAHPLLVDVDLTRYTLDPNLLHQIITPRTRAIIPVHLYGCPVGMNPVLEFARENNLLVVEDCSQAHGALFQGRKVGSLGDIAAFSFYPTKNLGAFGDGGAVVTSNPILAEKVRLLP